LKYADLDGAEEALERASERAGLLDDYGEARELYGREYRNLVRELDGLRRDLDEVESNLHELMEIGEVDEAVEELSRFESAVETYNEAVSDDLRSFLERDFSELVDVLLHAD
ncbi:MAG: hypothetical protein GWN18_11455, partial [Thermoplasmata archaeon]|nr:DUF3450 domain-containing protein [Thermoplasmata archaeon]NIT76076.1 DUF3450 domain-containing protein [Thermoplasmata archaeon]NIU49659.1 DUF3450 domain-containing protein [Thermoplasmata archaeon]NIV79328.1 hypothetical protein [Thermoplasmata archaeon]NIW83157.1 hypothetical protein [Thermoplasmata archaeon]